MRRMPSCADAMRALVADGDRRSSARCCGRGRSSPSRTPRGVLLHRAADRARARSRGISTSCTAPMSSHVSGNLADRRRLRAELGRIDAEVFVVELKAAAVDVVAEEALARGVRGRPRRERRRAAPRRAGPRRGAASGSRPRRPAAGRAVSERRYLAPLPLGGDDGPPWSKGLMARALAATGLTLTRAYELARRADADLAERGAPTARSRPARRARGRGARRARARAARCAACAGCRRSSSSSSRSSCSSAAPRVPASRRSRRRRRTGSGSRASRRRTSSGRRCARSSRRSSCRPSTSRASRRAGVDEGRGGGGRRRRVCSASSTRRGTCSSASRRRSTARSPRAGRWCSRASTSCPGMVAGRPRERARRPVRRRDRRRGAPPEPLLGARLRDRGPAAAREVHRGHAGDPADPGAS